MEILSWERVQQGLVHRSSWVRALTLLGLCLAVGVPVGAILGLVGALYGTALIAALVIGYLMMRSLLLGLVVLGATICLLPFATLPFSIGFSPTFLDLALLVLFFIWISRLFFRREGVFIFDSPSLAVVAFMFLAVVSFVLGLSHSPLTANVLRHFLEILLSVSLFLLVINTVRTLRSLQVLVASLIVCGFLAAIVGVVLYVLPQSLTIRLLSALRIVRYPTGEAVLRYIEDNPELPLRATSTSIDPNVLGGMLIFVTTLAGAQVMARRPLFPRLWLVVMLGTMLVCMILTFSRGSFVGLAVALLLLGLLRYPRMLWIGLLILVGVALLPPMQAYVQHFVEGVQGEDLATQMRFGEFKDAFILISRYPWFGVGFSGAPDIDTYLGVSNVYLLIAEEMGLVGLAAFLMALFAFLVRFVRVRAHEWHGRVRDSQLEPLLLGNCLAIAGALVGGAVDHYLFNLDFPHAAALFWLIVGLGTVSMRLTASAEG